MATATVWWLSTALWPGWRSVERFAWIATIVGTVVLCAGVLVRVVDRVRRAMAGRRLPQVLVGRVPLKPVWWQPRELDRVVVEAAASGRTTVLTGMGGAGKTHLAAGCVRQLQAGRRALDVLVWVNASTTDTIVAGYAHAAQRLGLASARRDASRAASAFLAWLQTTSRRWLVVLDDLTAPGDLSGWWPTTTSRGRVLVTTRRDDTALHGEGRIVIDVELFTPVEARQFLQRALPSHPRDEIDQLATVCGFLPLVLSQAAAYMRDRGLPCRQYVERFAARRLSNLLPERDALPDEQRATAAATWSLSIERADQLRPERLARPIFDLACLLDSGGIPVELFTTTACRRYLTTVTGRDVTDDDVRDALHNLKRFHLLSLDGNRGTGEPAGQQVQVHAITQRATRDDLLTDSTVDRPARAAADALLDLWPDPEPGPRLSAVLRANTAALHSNASDALLSPDVHRVLFRAVESLGDSGQAAAAAELSQRLLADCIRKLGPDHPHTQTARHNLAHWRGEAGDAAGALAEFEALLADRLRTRGPDDRETLRARGPVAGWRGLVGDPAGAVADQERLLLDRLRVLGVDDPDTLRTRGNLARWQGEAGDPATAVTALTALIPDLVPVFGADHPTVLRARHNLAYLRGVAGDPVGAVAGLQAVLEDRRRVLTPDHPDTLRCWENLARWQAETGDTAGAVTTLTRLIPELTQVYGVDHPAVLRASHRLAHIQGETDVPASDADALETLLPDTVHTRFSA